MPALELELALRQLEESNEELLAVLGARTSDLMPLCRALDRRAHAITKIALLSEEAAGVGDVVARLAAALAQGEMATRKLIETRREVYAEFGRLKHLQSALAPGANSNPEVDCRG